MAETRSGNNMRKNLERLSQEIIESLKELSNNREAISVSSLSQALAGRKSITDIISSWNPASAPSAEVTGQDEEATRELKTRVREMRRQKENLLRQVDDLSAQNSTMEAFCKRSLLALISQTSSSENTPVFEHLARLKHQLLDDAPLTEVETALSELKEAFFREDIRKQSDARPEQGEKGLFSRLFGGKEASGKPDLSAGVHLKQMQEAYLNILREFNLDLSREFLDRVQGVQQRIKGSETIDQLFSYNGDILALIQTFVRLVNDERSQIAGFVADMGSGLLEVENHFLSSLTRTSQAQESNTSFNALLEGRMEDIKTSVQLTKTLTELRSHMNSQLAAIREALEDKHRKDLEQQELARQELANLQQTLTGLKTEIAEAKEKSKALERENLMDTLTDIPNRRAYDLRFKEEFQRFRRYDQLFSLLVFDVDHFKNVNDTYGHRAGDKCLREIIKRIKPILRESDFLARYGGEEFVILLPGIDEENAQNVAERLCRIIERTRFLYQTQEIPLTISIGVSQTKSSDQHQDTLFNRADKAMYAAKAGGRNRVAVL